MTGDDLMDNHFGVSAQKRETKSLSKWEKEDFFDLICTGCDFYKPEEEKLECGAFKILVKLLKDGVVSIEQVAERQCEKK